MVESKISRRRSIGAALSIGAAGAAVAMGAAVFVTQPADAAEPHIVAALDHLKSALGELHGAIPDHAGHRGHAIDLVQQAIFAVNEAIAAGAK